MEGLYSGRWLYSVFYITFKNLFRNGEKLPFLYYHKNQAFSFYPPQASKQNDIGKLCNSLECNRFAVLALF